MPIQLATGRRYLPGMEQQLTKLAAAAVKRGLPDHILRAGCRHLIRQRLREDDGLTPGDRAAILRRWHAGLHNLTAGKSAERPGVFAEFFSVVLGARLRHSSGLWDDNDDLDEAQNAMLEVAVARAGIEDGMRVLDLGSGWGALSLYLAGRFPNAEIVAVSGSESHGAFIRKQAAAAGLSDVAHVTADVNRLDLAGRFDAVLSIETTEQIRSLPEVLDQLAHLTNREATVFVQLLSYTDYWWEFEDRGPDAPLPPSDSGDGMPSHNLFHRLIEPHRVEESWWMDGSHYRRTVEAWLARLDASRPAVATILRPIFGDDTKLLIQRWRIFLMACSELVGFAGSELLGVSHHRLRPAI